MQMRNGVLALAMVALFGLANVGYSKNVRLLDAVQKRATSLSQGVKRLFVNDSGKHALWQQLATGAGLAIIACTSINCGGSVALQGVAQEQQYVRSPEEIIGRYVHFVSEGKDYIGYVDEATNSDEVEIDLFDGSIMTVKTKQVRGVMIEEHHDEGRQVILKSAEEGQIFLHAYVAKVYDSNYYELFVGAYIDNDGEMNLMEFPYIIVTHFNNIIKVFGEPID